MIELAVLGIPVAKGRGRVVRATGHVFTPEKTRRFEDLLRLAANEVMGDRPPLAGPLEMAMDVVVPVPASWSGKRRAAALAGGEWPTKKPDGDNFLKVKDALNQVVWIDDAQIVRERIEKRYGEKPGMWIRVWQIAPKGTEAFG